MHALLGLLLLAPKEPNWADGLFGRWADQAQTYANQQELAIGVGALLVLALAWRQLQTRPALIPDVAKDEQTKQWANRVITAGLVLIALLSSVNYFYGTRNNSVYLHRWDAFHTVIGAKYHSELGYFDLYKCSYALDREGPRHFKNVDKIRDLSTRKIVPANQVIAGNDCKERFRPERLEEFRHDLDQFGTWSNRNSWRKLFKDKGFNGTPFYATVSKAVVSTVDVNLDSLRRLAYIDPLLMMIGFGFVAWAFGLRKAAIVALCFTTFFPNRYIHMGGSILRYDYVATLLVGFSALKKDKWGLAGAMFAWATMVRVFPAIFAVGVGIKVIADVAVDREIRPEHWKFAGWYVGVMAVCFVISLIGMQGGFENWQTWKHNIDIHNKTSAGYRIGFKHLFMLDGKLTSGDYGQKQANFVARENYYWAAVLVLFAPLLSSVRRLDTISFAAMFGVFGFFLLAIATRYYWGVIAILFLVDRDLLRNRFMMIIGAVVFFSAGFDYFYFELNDNSPLMYNTLVGVELTLVVMLMASWLLFNPSLLEFDGDARIPEHVPARLGARAQACAPPTKKKTKKKKKKTKQAAGQDKADAPDFDPDAVTVSDKGALAKESEDVVELLSKGALSAGAELPGDPPESEPSKSESKKPESEPESESEPKPSKSEPESEDSEPETTH